VGRGSTRIPSGRVSAWPRSPRPFCTRWRAGKTRTRLNKRQSLETLLAVARTHPDVHVVRATIAPDNRASRSLIEGYGFTRVGEQWDEEDGLEIIFEVSAGSQLSDSGGSRPACPAT